MRALREIERPSRDAELGIAAVTGFIAGMLALFAVQAAIRAVSRARARRRGGRIDDLIVNRRYEPRPAARIPGDDPWTHYEEVLG
ncbi:MAG TPA: hypothetical protein VMH86_10490 [Rhizomicrobium sp.]|nr:hypothetical protein [Rhizomicrobium sp.]